MRVSHPVCYVRQAGAALVSHVGGKTTLSPTRTPNRGAKRGPPNNKTRGKGAHRRREKRPARGRRLARLLGRMGDYYFPALLVIPSFDTPVVASGRYAVARRRWQTSTFDLTTLATRHKLHLPYQLMDVFLGRCNAEVCVRDVASFDDACDAMYSLRLLLYAQGVSPFLLPFATSHSINAYSGINSRDSDLLRAKLPDDMKDGIKSDTVTVEAWPLEMSLSVHALGDRTRLDDTAFIAAVNTLEIWLKLRTKTPALGAFGRAVTAAPTVHSLDQAVLHLWSGLESLFPTVTSEVSFKVALYLGQLQTERESRRFVFDQARRGYKVRSAITHGTRRDVTYEDWRDAWDLAMATLRAVLRRGALPTEDELVDWLLPE